jgi:hypothetical protein
MMPLDEEFLHARIELRARRSRDRAVIPQVRPPVREIGQDGAIDENGEFEDRTGIAIMGLSNMGGMP